MTSNDREGRPGGTQRNRDWFTANGTDRWTETQLADWLRDQIVAHDSGTLPTAQAAQIAKVYPDWLSDDTRFHYGLFLDWTQPRLAAFLSAKLREFDAGTMPSAEVARMNRTMPDWCGDAARIFCGLAPISA